MELRFCSSFSRTICIVISATTLVPPLLADVTISSRYVSASLGGRDYSHRILRIKGSKLRLDTGPTAEPFVTIYDLNEGTEIVWDPKQKRAEIHDLLRQSSAARHRVPTDNVQMTIEPTSNKRVFLGRSCRVYDFHLSARVAGRGSTFEEHLRGAMCISEESPETKDVVDFIETARKQGIVFSAQDSNSADARLRTELYFYQSAVRGLVLARNERIEFGGGNSGTSSGQWTLEVESINTEPIPDELFAVSTDWKVKKGGSNPGRFPIHWKIGRREPNAQR